MRGHQYTAEQLAWMEANRTLHNQDFHRSFQSKFGVKVSFDGLIIKRRTSGWKTERRRASKTRAIGAEYMSTGYVVRKISDDCWRFAHHVEWEAENGPIPDGYRLKCKGDRSDPSPSNWDLITNSMIASLYNKGVKYEDAPEDLKRSIMALAKLEHGLRCAKDKGARLL